MSKARLHTGTVAIVIAIVSSSGTAWADAITTSDGSRLVGKVEQWAAGKVIIITDIAGKLEIDTSRVVGISVDEPITVELESGDRLVGTVEITATGPVVNSTVGPVPIESSKIKSAWRPDQESPEVVAIRGELEKTKLAYRPHWTTTIEAGIVAKEGNTDSLDGRGRIELNRKTPEDLLTFYAMGRYSEQNDERSANEYIAGSRYENLISERWYWYLRSELEYDEFENLDLRAMVAGGVGYYWLKKPEHELKTSVGVGYRHESYDNGVTNNDAIADLNLGYRVDLTPWSQFTHSTMYSPSLERFDDYRLVFDTAMLFPLKADEWKLKLGMRNEYNSDPQPGNKRRDDTYYANILVELK